MITNYGQLQDEFIDMFEDDDTYYKVTITIDEGLLEVCFTYLEIESTATHQLEVSIDNIYCAWTFTYVQFVQMTNNMPDAVYNLDTDSFLALMEEYRSRNYIPAIPF